MIACFLQHPLHLVLGMPHTKFPTLGHRQTPRCYLALQDPTTPLTMQHYRGIYMLQEKVSRNNDRVNVTKFNATEDMSGEHNITRHGIVLLHAGGKVPAPAGAGSQYMLLGHGLERHRSNP